MTPFSKAGLVAPTNLKLCDHALENFIFLSDGKKYKGEIIIVILKEGHPLKESWNFEDDLIKRIGSGLLQEYLHIQTPYLTKMII